MRITLLVLFTAFVHAQTRVDWNALIPAIRKQLDSEPGQSERPYSIGIREEADVTGDGIPEALVYLGNGGAYTDYLAVMRVVDDKPVFANFKARDGRISQLGFAQGASVMHTIGVELRSPQQAVFSFHHDLSGALPQKVVQCGGEAYRWNRKTDVFEYDERLSKSFARTYCRQVRSGITVSRN